MINEEDTYDFVKCDGKVSNSPKGELMPISVKLFNDLTKQKEEIKELQITLASYKQAIQKLIIEKDLLLQIINTSGGR